MLASVATLAWIDYCQPSLAPTGWLLPFGPHRSLAGFCASEVARRCAGSLVIVAPAGMGRILEPLLASSSAPVIEVSGTRQISGLLEAAARLSIEEAVFVHLLFGLGLFPDSLLMNLSGRRAASESSILFGRGLPAPLFAAACTRDSVEILSSLPEDAIASDSFQDMLCTFERLLSSGQFDAGLGIASSDVQTDYGLPPADVPSHVPWLSPADVGELWRIYESTPAQPLERLRAIRRSTVSRMEAAHRRPPRTIATPDGPLRVLYASAPSAYSGAEECLVNSARAVAAFGVEAHAVVSLEGHFTRALRAAGVAVASPQRDFFASNTANALLLDDVVADARPDLVHCNAAVGSALLSVTALRRIPLIQWVRVADLNGWDEHLLRADTITTVSRFIACEVSRRMVDPTKVRVLYDAVDCERFCPGRPGDGEIRREFGIAPDDFLILAIARFAANKRHDVLLTAFAEVSRSVPTIKLMLIGDPQNGDPVYAAAMRLIGDLGASDRVIVLGFQPDVRPFEAAADAIVLCSERDPLGTVVLEGMAMAKPVVVAQSGGLPEMIDDGVTGLHSAPGSAASLAVGIRRLVEDRELGSRLGASARQAALARFSLPAHARALRTIYDETLIRASAVSQNQ